MTDLHIHHTRLTPQMRGVLQGMARAGHPPLHTRTPEEARKAYEAGAGVLEVPKAALPRVEDFHIPARDSYRMPARLYAPVEAGGRRAAAAAVPARRRLHHWQHCHA